MAHNENLGNPGEIFSFLDQAQEALDESEKLVLKNLTPKQSEIMQPALAQNFNAMRNEIGQARQEFKTKPKEAELAGEALHISATTKLVSAQRTLTKSSVLSDKESAEAAGKILDLVKIGLDKILEYIADGLLKKILKDLSILFPQIKEFLVGKEDKVKNLTDDVAELEAKIERFLYQVLGNPLVKDETKKGADKIPPVTGAPDKPTLPGSLLWYAWDIEHKLEHVWKRLTGRSFPRATPDSIVTDPEQDNTNLGIPISEELRKLTETIECLAKLLGKTLYNAEWDCQVTAAPPADPPAGELHPIAQGGHRGARVVPPISIKDELHAIEDMLRVILDILRNPPIPPEPPIPPVIPVPIPGGPTEVSAWPAELKRIFVYQEKVFTAAFAGDSRIIKVQTAAFDLTGWIDLTDLTDGDSVLIQMFVLLPGNVTRLYREKTFADAQQSGLKHLSDVVGPGYIAGNHIHVVITQLSSANNFSPGLDIAYQFVVESQARTSSP